MPRQLVVLHSAYGRTRGVIAVADALAGEDLEVIVPDFYRGEIFDGEAEGVAHRDEVGYTTLLQRVTDDLEALGDIDEDAAFLGFSLGASFAQRLVKQRPQMSACILIGNTNPVRSGTQWPGVPVQVHHLEADPWVEADEVAALMDAVKASGAPAELHVSPGEGHLFTEPGLREYDEALTAATVARISSFLHR